jgi:hypothetical protein
LFDLQTDPEELHELDQASHPIAMRYGRVLLGQFLGARDRGDWLSAEPKTKSVALKGTPVAIDPATRAHLAPFRSGD